VSKKATLHETIKVVLGENKLLQKLIEEQNAKINELQAQVEKQTSLAEYNFFMYSERRSEIRALLSAMSATEGRRAGELAALHNERRQNRGSDTVSTPKLAV
jgi:septal ring factor EnvC (AmiA/AmiB activator)